MKRNVNDVANVLISAASIKSIEIRKLEPIFVMRTVMGVCIGPAEISAALTAGLAYLTSYVATYEYERTRARKVNRALLRRLYDAICVSGDVRFDGRFVGMWKAIHRELNSQDALRRLGYAVRGDSSQLVLAVTKMCVEWVLRTIEGTGYMPELVREDSGMYEEIVMEFKCFALKASADINLDDINVVAGFKAIDLKRLPVCNDAYDIFISYRRSDGDVYARLLNQELSYQGLKCFFDVESVSHGEYNLQILSALNVAPHFLFLKTAESMNGLDDPDDHVRIELEAARFFQKNVIIVAPMGVARDMSRINLPAELEYLRDLKAYRLDVGETYEFCIDKILQGGVRHEQLA